MANIKSSKKDIRRIITRTKRNRCVKSRLKTLHKKWQEALSNKNGAETEQSMRNYISALEKASKRNLIHRNKVSRHKSICMQKTKQLA